VVGIVKGEFMKKIKSALRLEYLFDLNNPNNIIEYCEENDKTYEILSTEWAKNFQKLPQEKIEYLVKYKKTPPNMVGFN
jgi:hypothetical protein